MPGLFQGLEVGRRALLTSQMTLQTIGHNIANVNTPGYTRQRVNIASTMPESNTIGSIGSGVQVTDIKHIRDLFLGNQYRQESKSLGEWTYKDKVLSQVESVFNEPSRVTLENGTTIGGNLSDKMNDFWKGWDNFSQNPSDFNSRKNLIHSTSTMVSSFNKLSDDIDKLRSSIDADMNNYTSEINRLTGEVSRLNLQIKSLEVGGVTANDLRDTRDLILDNLSSLVDINTNENQNGDMVVYIGSMSVVNGGDAINIEAKVANVNGTPTHKLVWEGTDFELTNTAGQLKALIESRDVIIPKYIEKLDTLAAAMVEQVNALHVQGETADGQTGISFFDPTKTTAETLSINPSILSDSSYSLVVSAKKYADSDGTLASDIAKIRNENVLSKT